jgi:glycogen debranching enzyme
VVAKNGEPFFICPPDGQVPVGRHHGYGLFHHDCRFLSGYEVTVGGRRPSALGAVEGSGAKLVMEVNDPELRQQVGLTWTRDMAEEPPTLTDRLELRNYAADAVDLPIEFRFGAGFEDVFEVRGLTPRERGKRLDPVWRDGRLEFGYEGADGIDRYARVGFDRAPADQTADGATVTVTIAPRAVVTVGVTVELEERPREGATPIERRDSPSWRPPTAGPRHHARIHARSRLTDGWVGGEGWRTSIRTSSLALHRVLARSLEDLAELCGRLDGLRYYEAGIPWFATLFGRDAIIAAYQSLAFEPDIAADTLRLLAQRQGRTVDEWRDEEPGKILHELRIGELARLGEIPQSPYYGTIDATPLFLILLGRHADWTGSLDLFRELSGAVDAALDWLDRYGDSDGDGFIDYRRKSAGGLTNQGWKDSGDGIIDGRGHIADGPVALAEVQGYAWRAWREMATLFERAGDAGRAADLRARAAAIQQRFEERFWSDDLGCYILALGNGAPCDVVTSNAGQVLWTGIASPERAARVGERLMEPDMFAGWGIRTLSSSAVAYHPIGYHLGTVWPHDNSLIGRGFRRYGLDEAAERLFLGLLDAAQDFPNDRLPECFAGFGQEEFGIPVRYPVACHPQAWAAGAIPELLVSTLGLEPDGFAGCLRVRRPLLPEGVEVVEVRDLPVGSGTAHLRFVRRAGETSVEVLETTGDLKVVTGPDADGSSGEDPAP